MTSPVWSDIDANTIELGPWKGRMRTVVGPTKFKISPSAAPWGVSVFNGKKDIQLEDRDSSWVSWIRDVEMNVMRGIESNSQEIFGSPKDLMSIQEIWNSNYKDGKLRIKADHCSWWDIEGKPLTPPDDPSGWLSRHTLTALVEVPSVYFFQGKCGLVWKAAQIKIHDIPPSPVSHSSSLPAGVCLM